MVNFNEDHKITIPTKNRSHFEWIGEDGRIKDINVTQLSDTELFALRNTMRNWFYDQMQVIDDEVNRWEPVYCAVCGEQDLAFRGKPFITWGLRGGYILCPRHTRRFDRYGDKEIKELLG